MKKTRPKTAIEILTATILLIVSGMILFVSLTPGHGWGGDFAAYLHQGKALATGSLGELHQFVTYRVNHSNSDLIIGPTYYPWGFPALVAAVISLFGESIIAMKALIVILMLGSQLVVYLLLRGRVPLTVNLAISFFFGINAFVLVFVDEILSDIPFTFFVLLTMLLAKKFLLEKREPSILNLVAIGVAMFTAFAVRTHGIALVPTVAVLHYLGKVDAMQRWSVAWLLDGLRRIRSADATPYVVFLAGAWFASAALSNPIESYASSGHTKMLNGLALQIKGMMLNVYYYSHLPNAFFNVPNSIYVLLIVPLMALGIIRAGSRNFDLLVLLFFYMAVLIVYPGRQGLRFLLPILPILLLYLFIGTRYAGSWLRRIWPGPRVASLVDAMATLLVIVGLALCTVAQTFESRAESSTRQFNDGPYEATSQQAFEYIKTNVASDENVVFWKPRVLTYLTERNSAFEFRFEELINGNYDYVLVQLARSESDEWGRRIVETTSKNSQFFRRVFSNKDFVLYQIQEPAPTELR